jgi:hypothetical protein
VDPHLSQLAADAHASPAAVLPAEAADELDQLFVHGRPAWSSLFSPSSPLAFGRLAVPSKQGLEGDQKGAPTFPGDESAERCKDCPVRRPVPHTYVELALQHMDLVPEHHDLDLLVGLGATCRADKAEKPAEAQV